MNVSLPTYLLTMQKSQRHLRNNYKKEIRRKLKLKKIKQIIIEITGVLTFVPITIGSPSETLK